MPGNVVETELINKKGSHRPSLLDTKKPIFNNQDYLEEEKEEEEDNDQFFDMNISIRNALTVNSGIKNAGTAASTRNLMKYQKQHKSQRRSMPSLGKRLSTRLFKHDENADSSDDNDENGGAHLLDSRRLFLLESKQDSKSTYFKSQFDLSISALNENDVPSKEDTETTEEEAIMANTTKTQETSTSTSKGVSFTKVSIREHPIIVGDNPGGRKGVPVTIAWETCNDPPDNVYELEKYEAARVGHRRSTQHLRMSKEHRDGMLKELGISLSERLEGAKHATLIRNRRQKVNKQEKHDKLHEKIEDAKLKFNALFKLGQIREHIRRRSSTFSSSSLRNSSLRVSSTSLHGSEIIDNSNKALEEKPHQTQRRRSILKKQPSQ